MRYDRRNGPGASPAADETAAQRVAGDRTIGAIEFRIDQEIERIVQTWPLYASADRAGALGLPQDRALDDIVRAYVAEFLS